MTTLRRIARAPVAMVLSAFMLSASILIGSFAGVRGDSHDDTYYACLYAGALTQVNTTAPPANCGRGVQIEWTSFGGVIDASMIADGSLPGSVIQEGTLPGSAFEDSSIDTAKLNEDLQQQIKCGAFPHFGVDWSGCDLAGAYLQLANLTGANLTGANLFTAYLVQAVLVNADLTGADLTGANLFDADMNGAILTGVIWDETICPDGTNSDDNGNTCVGHE